MDLAGWVACTAARAAEAGGITSTNACLACVEACTKAGRITRSQAGVPACPSLTGVEAGHCITRYNTRIQAGVAGNTGSPAGECFTRTPACPPGTCVITGVVTCFQARDTRIILTGSTGIPARYTGIGAGKARIHTSITGELTRESTRIRCFHADHTRIVGIIPHGADFCFTLWHIAVERVPFFCGIGELIYFCR